MPKKYVGTPGVKRNPLATPDELTLSSAIVHEPTAKEAIAENPSFHIYQKVCRSLLEARQEPTMGQHIHDHLWDCWMADKSYTEAVGSVPEPPVETIEP